MINFIAGEKICFLFQPSKRQQSTEAGHLPSDQSKRLKPTNLFDVIISQTIVLLTCP